MEDKKIKDCMIEPNEIGIMNKNKEKLKGKNAEYNAKRIVDIFKGVKN